MWTESSWDFPESYTADESWIVRSSDGGQQGDKRAHNFTIKVISAHYTFVSLHDSDHEDVVRIFVAFPASCELFIYIIYINQVATALLVAGSTLTFWIPWQTSLASTSSYSSVVQSTRLLV